MKVHISINGQQRSLCGMQPRHGSYDIRTMATFFQVAEQDRCSRCVHHLLERGYAVTKLSSVVGVVSRAAVVADRL